MDDPLSFGARAASVLFDRGELVGRGESLALPAGEWDPLERGESVALERFFLALGRGDSLPLRRGESLPRRRGESLLRLLGDPDDLLRTATKIVVLKTTIRHGKAF